MQIQQIRLKNFKAFKDEEVFDIECKNILICGNNGSGKSSLHFALHVFFQSSIKDDSYKKYFRDPKSTNGDESLLNIYGDPKDYLLELSVKKTDGIIAKYQIKETVDKGAVSHHNQDIKNSDFASDFISHRLLANFYNFRNSQGANIWFLFEKGVFPYWMDDERQQTFDKWLSAIKNEFEELSQQTEIIVDDSKLTDDTGTAQKRVKKFNKNSEEYKAIQSKITDFNKKFLLFYDSIKDRINEILFCFLPEDKLEVSLEYTIPLDTDSTYEWLWNKPELLIRVKSNGEAISKPHIFLNEARLTALALSIRLAMFDKKFKGTGGDAIKLLVLDDLLISLDMSFRMKLVKFIQEQQAVGKSFEGYQIFILTHDKSLFDVLKSTLAKDVTKWKWFEFFDNNTYPIANAASYKNPIIIEDKDFLTIANEYLTGVEKIVKGERVVVREKSYELCALFLRKKTEQILKLYFDPEMEQIFKLKILENLERGLGSVEKEWTQKQKQSFEKLIEREIDLEKLAALKAFNLTAPAGTVEDEPKKTNDANNLKNALYTYIEEYQANFAKHQADKKELLKLTKALHEIRARILNEGAHANTNSIFELELIGAIKTIGDFQKVVLQIIAK